MAKAHASAFGLATILLQLVSGSPTATPVACSPGTGQLATFDDIPGGIPGTALNQIPVPYKGLRWKAFTYALVAAPLNSISSEVVPNSGNGVAAVEIFSKANGSSPVMTVDYPTSTITSFDLYSFYYACAVDELRGQNNATQACSIVLTAYGATDSKGNEHPVCVMAFTPSPNIGQDQMAYSGTVFDCFRGTGMTHIAISYLPSEDVSAASARTTLALDTISYVTHNCPP